MATANPSSKGVGTLTMDKAAFLLIRIKRAFLKKRNKGRAHVEKAPSKKKPPLLRARTLPAIICPSLNIIQAQLEPDANSKDDSQATTEGGKTKRHFSGSSSLRKSTPQERERCFLDPEVEPAKSPLGSPRTSVTSVTSGTSTLSTQSSGKENAKQKSDSTKAGLSRLAKLLSSKEKTSTKNTYHFPSTIPNIEVTPLRRSGSVDSLLDTSMYPADPSELSSNCSSMACLAPSCSSVNLLSPTAGQSPTTAGSLTVPVDGRTIPTSPSVPAKLEAHRRGDIPSSPSVPNKLTKGQCVGSPEVFIEGLPLNKAERKRLEKLNKINIDLQGSEKMSTLLQVLVKHYVIIEM